VPKSSGLKLEIQSKKLKSNANEPVLACIDLGTNSFHMIVCRVAPNREQFEVMFRSKEAVPFFRRSLADHFIDEAAVRSALRIIKDMARQAKEKGATTIIAVATSAVRESKNGEAFLERIRNNLNIDANMLSGSEEARLIYLGVIWSMPELTGNFAIIDIGGGSTEIIVGNKQQTSFMQSYKLGAARLAQRFFGKDLPTREKVRQIHEEVAGVLQPTAVKIEACGGFKKLVGTSGTIQALAKIDRELEGLPDANLHGWRLPLERLKHIISYIEDCSIRNEKIKFVSNDRAQTILSGSIVLIEAMKAVQANEIIICTAALREGVAVDRFLQTGWLDSRLAVHQNPRSLSVSHLLKKYQGDVEHAQQVAWLACEIFWQTRKIMHNYSDDVVNLLWAAAMLHDIGIYIGRSGHHKHSYYLIKQEELLGYNREEIQVIASIARYHRGSSPKETHDAWVALPTPERKLVTDMAAILRLAEALDRSHRQIIQSLSIKDSLNTRIKHTRSLSERKMENKKINTLKFEAIIKPGSDGKAEAWALGEKKSLFAIQFKKEILLDFKVAQPKHNSPSTNRGLKK